MSAARDTGGPAFPTCFASPHDFPDGSRLPLGMTLRDYFAGQVLAGFMANKDRPTRFLPEDDAAYCYSVADAMLVARKEGEST